MHVRYSKGVMQYESVTYLAERGLPCDLLRQRIVGKWQSADIAHSASFHVTQPDDSVRRHIDHDISPSELA